MSDGPLRTRYISPSLKQNPQIIPHKKNYNNFFLISFFIHFLVEGKKNSFYFLCTLLNFNLFIKILWCFFIENFVVKSLEYFLRVFFHSFIFSGLIRKVWDLFWSGGVRKGNCWFLGRVISGEGSSRISQPSTNFLKLFLINEKLKINN